MPPNYLNYVEERLELGYDYGARGGPRWKTDAFELGNGSEQRNSKWSLPVGRWQLGNTRVVETEMAPVNYLRAFFDARQGSTQGFRFKDWNDYRLSRQRIGVGDGTTVSFQIYKRYSVTDQDYCDRPLQKIVADSETIWVDDEDFGIDYAIDYDTGIITFDLPPADSAVIEVACEFDVIVQFEQSRFPLKYLGGRNEKVYELGSLSVVVMPLPLPAGFDVGGGQGRILSLLDLGYYRETVESVDYGVSQQQTAAGYRRTDLNFSDSKIRLQIGAARYDHPLIDQLLNYAYVARGSARSFYVRHNDRVYSARFAVDQPLDFRFDYADLSQQINYLANLEFITTAGGGESAVARVNGQFYVATNGPINVVTQQISSSGPLSYNCNYPAGATIFVRSYSRVNGIVFLPPTGGSAFSVNFPFTEISIIHTAARPIGSNCQVIPGGAFGLFGLDSGRPSNDATAAPNPFAPPGCFPTLNNNFFVQVRNLNNGQLQLASNQFLFNQFGGVITDIQYDGASFTGCPTSSPTFNTLIYDNGTVLGNLVTENQPDVEIF